MDKSRSGEIKYILKIGKSLLIYGIMLTLKDKKNNNTKDIIEFKALGNLILNAHQIKNCACVNKVFAYILENVMSNFS